MFPLVALLSRGKWALEAAFVAALIALAVQAGLITDAVKILLGVPSFLFGALLFRYRDALARFDSDLALPAMLLVLIGAIALRWPEPAILGLVYAVVATAVAGDTRGAATPRWVRKLAPWGALTYSIYMWHVLFILVLMNALGDKLLRLSGVPMIALGLACYAAIALWSYWSWVHFERPARRAIDGIGRKPKGAEA